MTKLIEVAVNNWVSWLIELAAMFVLVYLAMGELKDVGKQATDEVKQISGQVGEMLSKYDKNISEYAEGKKEAVEDAATTAKDSAIGLLNNLKDKYQTEGP